MDASAQEPPPAGIRHELIERVVQPMLGFVPEDLDQDLEELGVDSMVLVHMLAQTEEVFGVELSPVDLMDQVSVASLARLVEQQRALA